MARFFVSYNKKVKEFLLPVVVDNTFLAKERLKKAGKAIPPPFRTKALIDTGASDSAGSPRLVEGLQLPTTSNMSFGVNTGMGAMRSYKYACAFKSEDEAGLGTGCLPIFKYKVENTAFDFVIGMDFLEEFYISYHPKEGVLWLEKPPPDIPAK